MQQTRDNWVTLPSLPGVTLSVKASKIDELTNAHASSFGYRVIVRPVVDIRQNISSRRFVVMADDRGYGVPRISQILWVQIAEQTKLISLTEQSVNDWLKPGQRLNIRSRGRLIQELRDVISHAMVS